MIIYAFYLHQVLRNFQSIDPLFIKLTHAQGINEKNM